MDDLLTDLQHWRWAAKAQLKCIPEGMHVVRRHLHIAYDAELANEMTLESVADLTGFESDAAVDSQ